MVINKKPNILNVDIFSLFIVDLYSLVYNIEIKKTNRFFFEVKAISIRSINQRW